MERRDTAELWAPPSPSPITWFSPAAGTNALVLARWRAGVGPPVIEPAAVENTTAADRITVVSWNTALGAADIPRLVATLPPGAPLVLLLQEVYRGGPEVPSALAAGVSFARRHGGAAAAAHYEAIQPIARKLGLSLYYVPSMRNGSPAASSEDRGNAILSNLSLTDLAAIELPFERQRRVAIAATVDGRTTMGTPWRLRVASAHLDNTFSSRHLWLAGEYGRARQARGLSSIFDGTEPTVLAGDFNTWFGFSDQAYREIALKFPDTRVIDTRATFRGLLRLDHFFFRLAPGWAAQFRRSEDCFGSDHFPLVGTVRFR